MITVEMSIEDIIWMLDNKDKLNDFQSAWITEFVKLMNEGLKDKMELVHGRFYWVKSEKYNVDITAAQYQYDTSTSWSSMPTFQLVGCDEIFYAHHFEVLDEIKPYENSQSKRPEDNQ